MSETSSDTNNQTPEYSWIDESLPDRPSDTSAGDTWRSREIYRCRVCHTLTNKWFIGGYPSRGPRIRCPANRSSGETIYEQLESTEREEKHDELRELVTRRRDLEERLQQYDSHTDSEHRTRERIRDEIDAVNNQITSLRDWFGHRFDDVVGVNPAEQEIINGLAPGRN